MKWLLAHPVEGAENDLLYQSNARQYRAPYVTANVNLWPRTEALIVNPGRLATLTGTQQRWLRRAATDAAARSTNLYANDSRIAKALCESGARFANASRAQLAALRHALEPVYATLEQDMETMSFIERIERQNLDQDRLRSDLTSQPMSSVSRSGQSLRNNIR